MPSFPESSAPTERLLNLIEQRTGLALRAKDGAHWEEIFASRLKILQLDDIAAYLQLLQERSEASALEWRVLGQRLTNNESYFWRDKGQFALLGREILPQIIQNRLREKKINRTLRFWSAGCSTGEEPYSLAMLWLETAPRLLGNDRNWRLQIFGSDLSDAALETARRGVYGNWSFRAFDLQRRNQYFSPLGQSWQIVGQPVSLVQFMPFNLASDLPVWRAEGWHDFDLILCRNVLIYFAPDAITHVLRGFAQALRPEGFLMTGHAELATQKVAGFTPRLFPESVVYQKPAATPSAAPSPVAIRRQIAPQQSAPQKPFAPTAPVPSRVSPPPKPTSKTVPARPLNAASPKAPIAATSPDLDRAQRLANSGQHDEAARLCEAILQQNPTNAAAHLLLARVEIERGEVQLAKTHLKKTIYLAPDDFEAFLELAAVYEIEDDALRARTMREGALAILRARPADEFLAAHSQTAGELAQELEGK